MEQGDVTARSVAVTSRNVTIMGPAGFCVDPKGSTSARDHAFVVLGSCAAIADEPTLPQPDVPVVLTAAVARDRAVSPTALAAYFRAHKAQQEAREASLKKAHAEGKKAHGAMKLPAAPHTGLHVLDVALKGDVVYLHFRDRTHPGNWRGILGLDPDVTITLGLSAAEGVRLSEATQLAMLRDFAQRIVRANSDRIIGTPRA